MADQKTKDDFKGTPAYECELCGGVSFKIDCKGDTKTLVTFLQNGPAMIAVGDIPRNIVHLCPNGARGIARIVGLVPDELLAAATMSPVVEEPDDDNALN